MSQNNKILKFVHFYRIDIYGYHFLKLHPKCCSVNNGSSPWGGGGGGGAQTGIGFLGVFLVFSWFFLAMVLANIRNWKLAFWFFQVFWFFGIIYDFRVRLPSQKTRKSQKNKKKTVVTPK